MMSLLPALRPMHVALFVVSAILPTITQGEEVANAVRLAGREHRLLSQPDVKSMQAEQLHRIVELNAISREHERLRRMLAETTPKLEPSEYEIADEMERDPSYYQLIDLIDQYKDEIENLSDTVQPNSNQVIELEQEIARLEGKRTALAKERRPRVVERIEARKKAATGPSQRAREIELNQQVRENLIEQLTAVRKAYDRKLADVEEFGLLEAQRASSIRDPRQAHLREAAEQLRMAEMDQLAMLLETASASALHSSDSPSKGSPNFQADVSALRREISDVREDVRKIRTLLEAASARRAEENRVQDSND